MKLIIPSKSTTITIIKLSTYAKSSHPEQFHTKKQCLGLCVFYGQNHFIIFLMNDHFMLCIIHPSFTADYERFQLDVMIPSTLFLLFSRGKPRIMTKSILKYPTSLCLYGYIVISNSIYLKCSFILEVFFIYFTFGNRNIFILLIIDNTVSF